MSKDVVAFCMQINVKKGLSEMIQACIKKRQVEVKIDKLNLYKLRVKRTKLKKAKCAKCVKCVTTKFEMDIWTK